MKLKFTFSLLLTFFFIYSCKMQYPTQKVTFNVSVKSGMVQEGKHLTMMICGPCHYDPSTQKLTGKKMDDVPGIFGKIYAKNLTNHPEKGIANYTSDELAFLIRTGISRSGKLMPFMKRPNLADDDLKSIIAFLKSDDALVASSDVEPGVTKYTGLGKMGMSASKPLPWTGKEIAKPTIGDNIALGKYLIDNLACFHCHSKSMMKMNELVPEKTKGYMGGGNKLKDKSGKTVITPNLTFHETGLGTWTLDEFKKALKTGISKDNSVIAYPMPIMNEMTDTEISAMWEYLKTIPKIDNKIKKN